MEEVVTPRFHKIRESRKDLKLIKEKSKKRRHSAEHISNKQKLNIKSSKKAKNSEKIKRIKLEESKNNSLFFHQFIFRNDFDKDHCKIFLKEKHLNMEKPVLLDEI
mgnify:CR=1 FL=1